MAGLFAMSALWSLPTLPLLDFVIPRACSESFRVDLRIFQSSNNQASDGVRSPFERKWLFALGAVYKVDHILVLDRDQVQEKGTIFWIYLWL